MELKAEITLLNVVHLDGPPRSSLKVKDLEDAMIDIARNEIGYLIKELKSDYPKLPKIHAEIIPGYPVEKIVSNYATRHKVDLIVLGTRGATGLKKFLLGSNAASVINKSRVPVLAVPELGSFKEIVNIAYATDMLNIKPELKRIVSFARKFNAYIHILHITSPREQKAFDATSMLNDLRNVTKYNLLSFAVSNAEDPVLGIDDFVSKNKIDVVAMFTHELSFFEKLLGKGVTRKIAFLTKAPLLTFKK